MAKENESRPDDQPPENPPCVPEQFKEEVAKRVVSIIRQEFSGPLPPPQILTQYNSVIPNGAERIMAMAEKQSDHRRGLEAEVISRDSRNSLLGIILGFVLGTLTVLSGAYVVIKGHSWPGTILGSGGVVGLVCAFIYGTRERRKERETKAKNM